MIGMKIFGSILAANADKLRDPVKFLGEPQNPPIWINNASRSGRADQNYIPNEETAYIAMPFSKKYGELLVLRWKSAITPELTHVGHPFSENYDMRYWSLTFAYVDKKKELAQLCRSADFTVRKFVDMRYQGQSYELSVPYDAHFVENFHKLHEHSFGYALNGNPLEVVSIRCSVSVPRPKQLLPYVETPISSLPIPAMKTFVLFFDGKKEADVYLRNELSYGHSLTGPAIISDNYTTIVLPSNFILSVDPFLNLIICRK